MHELQYPLHALHSKGKHAQAISFYHFNGCLLPTQPSIVTEAKWWVEKYGERKWIYNSVLVWIIDDPRKIPNTY